jgi:hypothetical protein
MTALRQTYRDQIVGISDVVVAAGDREPDAGVAAPELAVGGSVALAGEVDEVLVGHGIVQGCRRVHAEASGGSGSGVCQ